MSLLDIIGWCGMILIILAYCLNTINKISNSSLTYQLLNIVGSVLLGSSLLQKEAWSGVALQTVWIIISFYGMWSAYKNKK